MKFWRYDHFDHKSSRKAFILINIYDVQNYVQLFFLTILERTIQESDKQKVEISEKTSW